MGGNRRDKIEVLLVHGLLGASLIKVRGTSLILSGCAILVYPDKDIQNIVETEFQKIENWCPLKSLKCRKLAKVKPVRCLSGEFQSDALLVPHGCQFDHVHNASQCLMPDAWKVVAERSCKQRELELRSHAMLRPCGVDVFQGVEFVCCPHDAGLKGTVMKDWGVMEEKYQDMKIADPEKAEMFRREMTAKFQKRVDDLEADGEAEKQQIVSMHQQRILRAINTRKREALTCYREALNQRLPSIHKVEKCLQKLLRALHKDRHHTLAHYRHLLNANFEEAERQREITLERLMEVDRTVNQSLDMLNKFPELQQRLRPLMDEFADALRTKQNFADSATDGATFAPNSKLLSRTVDAEKETMDKLRDRALMKKKLIDDRKREEEEMRKQKMLNRMKKKQEIERTKQKQADFVSTSESSTLKTTLKPREDFDEPQVGKETAAKLMLKKFDPIAVDDDHSLKDTPVAANHFDDEEDKAHLVQHVPEEIPVAHAQAHELSHSQSVFSIVARETNSGSGSKAGYITVAFAGLALMTVLVVTIVVLRRRNVALPQNQGFVEVDQTASPEERHIANMQINGYENPTYKYFEESDM
ncbi:unnamed protein product [Notodromas monacha]|uniref:Uncharacterized protein n=1 Tax=Notodromas monacha TaxID=399045 RepID=A0A7R9BDC3_9CRUS|nr:unnamed protein product [Notodromas monacha]CAG0913233.1 unnamed protein product [Notodromas monacha]